MKSNTDLVRRAKAGDVSAFAALYETVYKDLYRFALYILGNPHDAEDAVSDAVTDAFMQISALRSEEAFRSWMFKILSIKCRKKLGQYASMPDSLEEDLPHEPEDLAQKQDVRRAFSRLNRIDRQILSLRIFGGYTSLEIAEEIHMNPSTVRSRCKRALALLRELLS